MKELVWCKSCEGYHGEACWQVQTFVANCFAYVVTGLFIVGCFL